jgi:hypothetical protein
MYRSLVTNTFEHWYNNSRNIKDKMTAQRRINNAKYYLNLSLAPYCLTLYAVPPFKLWFEFRIQELNGKIAIF